MPDRLPPADRRVVVARRAVYLVFIAQGFEFASWASRIPQVRAELRLTPGVLGLVLLCAAIGSGLATPLSGLIVARLSEAAAVRLMAVISTAGLALVAVGVNFGTGAVAAGLFFFGFGSGAWDVAMNVQGSAVEQALGRVILPRFHAGWSLGTVAGAGLGAIMVAAGFPVTVHLLAVAVLLTVGVPAATRGFLPRAGRTAGAHPAGTDPSGTDPAGAGAGGAGVAGGRRRGPLAGWTEPRTLLIGVFVLCVTVIEGTGNDWLSLAVIDGYHVRPALGTLTFAVFLSSMTAGRWFGPRLIDRYTRVPVLRASTALALAGLLTVAAASVLPLALLGALAMGLGTALGFPVGISSAADDPALAPGRVSTAASLGYVAFLAGPPAIGFVADHVGVHHGIAVAGVLLAAAFALAGATAELQPGDAGRSVRVR